MIAGCGDLREVSVREKMCDDEGRAEGSSSLKDEIIALASVECLCLMRVSACSP